jgi:hypothetical protein
MDSAPRPDEVRIYIEASDKSGGSDRSFVPASVFNDMFSSVLAALQAADEDLHGKKAAKRFFVSHLKIGSGEFGIIEQDAVPRASDAVALFKRVTQSVYRSEFSVAAEYGRLSKKLEKIGKKITGEYAIIAKFADGEEVPFDTFFANQTRRLIAEKDQSMTRPAFFAGSAFGAFDGRLGNIDYRGAVWIGHLVLDGSNVQIECVFDRSRGEDSFNRYGNKRVSVTGRAIYTGDSQLPERIQVVEIEEITPAVEYKEMRGSLTGERYIGFDLGD